jgi:hypothetical protein
MDNSFDTNDGVDRRTMLRRAAMGGAVVWATPVVQTLGMSVAAASTITYVACPPNDKNANPPKQLIFIWTGDPCSTGDGAAKVSSSGPQQLDNISQDVRIVATYGGGGPNTTILQFDPVAENTQVRIGEGTPEANIVQAGAQGIDKLNPEVTFNVYAAGTDSPLLRSVTIHTSCSQPLAQGDTFCGFTLIGGF